MSRGARQSAQHGTQYMTLSFCGFAFWWLVILGIHLVTCAYHIVYAKLYWGFKLTMFSYMLEYNGIGMPHQYYHSIGCVYIALAAVHGVCVLLMMVGSLWHRILVFAPRRRKAKAGKPRRTKYAGDTRQTEPSRGIQYLSAIYHIFGNQHGVLSVQGRHFHAILMSRELIEVALQSVQAIRMSKYLPRMLLNRFYVSLLVINCWSSVFVYSRWFWRDEARRRFAAIVCDCVLNLMTTIGVSLIIMLNYVGEYDINNFDWRLLENDEWVSQMLNEARVVLVMSWSDLATRAIFSLGLIVTTADMKELLRYTCTRRNRIMNGVGPSISLTRDSAATGDDRVHKGIPPQNDLQVVGHCTAYNDTGLRTRSGRKLLQGAHYAFAAWGFVILSLHVYATMQTPIFECTPKVYPMAGALPSCYTVSFNCYNIGISGTMGDVKSAWGKFDRSTAVKLRILHCRSFEVPDTFQDFSGLEDIQIYNSSIADWGDTAAITQTHHAKLKQITFARVNMTNGSLPLGLRSPGFPASLGQINFCDTNLETLPDDIDSSWPKSSVVFLENSNLSIVPSSLIRAQPFYLALTGNPITELHSELFESNIQYIFIGRTEVNELPDNVAPTTLSSLDVTYTNISSFPSWIDPLVKATLGTSPLLAAGGSTYCSDFEKITNGISANFSSPFRDGYSSLLMNSSESNWETLRQAVDCSPPPWATQFSMDYFDTTYGLGGVNANG